MKKFLFLLLTTFSTIAMTENIHYIDNSCALNGNGATGMAACATSTGGNGPWNSFANLTCAGVAAGDHIQIRKGKRIYNESNGNGYYSLQPPSSCSGSSAGAGSASTPVYLENYPGEDVVIDGTVDIRSSTWTARGGGVYECTSGTCAPAHANSWAWMAWYVPAGGGVEQEIYAIQYNGSAPYTSYVCDSTVPEGFLQLQSNLKVCVHLPGGASPVTAAAFRIPYVTDAVTLANGNSIHDFTIRHNPSGGTFTIRRYYFDIINMLFSANYNVTIDGLDASYALNRCIDVDNSNVTFASAPQNDAFTHNHIHHCGQEGIHFGADTLTETFTFNEVDHIQIPPWFQHTGSDSLDGPNFTDRGVGVRIWCMASASCYLANNIFHDSGGGHAIGKFGAINFEIGATNGLVENNIFYNLGPMGSNAGIGMGGIGIQIAPINGYEGCTPCTFRNNRFYNMDDSIQLESSFHYNLNVYNNTFANIYDGTLVNPYGTTTGTINVVNNVFFWSPTAGRTTGPAHGLLGVVGGGGGSFSTSGTFANNAFYCTQGCAGTIVNWPSTSYTSSTVTTTGNNTWGDPMLNLAVTGLPYDRLGTTGGLGAFAPWNQYKVPVPALFLRAPSGSAYRNGQAISPAFPDVLGSLRPNGQAWDIGAISYQPTPPAIAAPPNLTLH
jgi:hypothetical protein